MTIDVINGLPGVINNAIRDVCEGVSPKMDIITLPSFRHIEGSENARWMSRLRVVKFWLICSSNAVEAVARHLDNEEFGGMDDLALYISPLRQAAFHDQR
jgi:hypothetical protein